ncbi:MAG: hypothetical protein M1835_000876 [Candelina submexicana]|nr:MAG: hypothetical protein M1835_000876 [Candelina submexicana]
MRSRRHESTLSDTNNRRLDSNGDLAADARIMNSNTDSGDLPGSFGNPTDHQDSRLHPASFLSLPLEFRETIYSYLLLHKHRVRPHRARQMLRYCCDVHPEREYQGRVGENLGVLRVSHLLYDETTSYLYGSNESLFSDDTFEYERPHLVHYNDITDNFHYWLLTIGATNQRKIKHLIIGSCDTFLWRGNSDVEEDHDTMDDSREIWAKAFAKGMGLLAAGHGLRILKIELLGVLDSHIEWRGMLVGFFRSWDEDIVKALRRIRGVGRVEVEIPGPEFAGEDDFMDEDKLPSTIEEYIDDGREELGNCGGTVIADEEIECKVQELYVAFQKGIVFKDFGKERSWKRPRLPDFWTKLSAL